MTFDKQSQVGTADVLKALGHPTRLWIVKSCATASTGMRVRRGGRRRLPHDQPSLAV